MRTFHEIEMQRRMANIPRKRLYERAGLNHSTYGRIAKGVTASPLVSTVKKLDQALTALLSEMPQQEAIG